MQPDVISLGEPMLEFNAPDEGALSEVPNFTVGWGGDTSNFAVAARRTGGSVGYLTRLGADEFGDSFINLWRREGIDTTHVARDPLAATGIYFISRKGRQHHFTYYRRDSAASRMTPDFLPADYIAGAKLLHVSGISQAISVTACDTVFAAMGIARKAGRLVSYDPNYRPKLWPLERARAVVHESCRLADLVFPSLEDARALSGLQGAEEIARFYLGLGPKVVVLKLGADGALLATADGVQAFPPVRVESVDMSGAGDTFDGAFVVRYLSGRPLPECMRFENPAGREMREPMPQPEEEEAEDILPE